MPYLLKLLLLGLMAKVPQTLIGLLLLLLLFESPAYSWSRCTAVAVVSLRGCLCCSCLLMPPAAMLLRARTLLQAHEGLQHTTMHLACKCGLGDSVSCFKAAAHD
jgi:hypothetical protein